MELFCLGLGFDGGRVLEECFERLSGSHLFESVYEMGFRQRALWPQSGALERASRRP